MTVARPPKPRLVFRVGVVGHRPNRLPEADRPKLAGQLRAILALVRHEVEQFGVTHADLFAAGTAALRGVSSLAEGADRIFADEALREGYELCCPMPFPQAEFEKDFSAPHAQASDALPEFRELLQRAERESKLVRFEMDGARDDPADAYRACGRVLLNQSDLLVVVWDGERREEHGGTEETLDEARAKGVPSLWVEARAPHALRLLADAARPSSAAGRWQMPAPGDDWEQLRRIVREALQLPRAPEWAGSGHRRAALGTVITDLYAERRRRVNPGPLWRTFRALVGESRLELPQLGIRDYETAVEGDWPRTTATGHARVVDTLRPYYAWADRLAVIYADLYRSAFLVTYLMAGAAVGMALLALALGMDIYAPHLTETVFVGVELILILGILAIVWLGRRRQWHERFVDYRLTAELVRHLRISAPLGSNRPFPQIQAQLNNYGHPAATWMAWYVRAVERELGLPNVRLDVEHLQACAADLERHVDGQAAFHRHNAAVSRRIEHRLHRTGVALFAITAVACALHVVAGLGVISTPEAWILGTLTFAAGFLPALGSAIAGINNQGEFARLAKRYGGMHHHLEEILRDVQAFRQELSRGSGAASSRRSERLVALASETAQLMVSEVLDWRIVFLDRPLHEP